MDCHLKRFVFPVVLVFFMSISILSSRWGNDCPHLPVFPESSEINPRLMGASVLSAFLFGGMRGVFVDILWMYMDHLWHSARFYKLPPLYELVTMLQPSFIEAWVMGGWHMAYNMSHELDNMTHLSPVLRKKIEYDWIYRGISFLKAGLLQNPEKAKLAFEIAWTYYHRLELFDASIPWFEKCLELGGGHNSSRLIAHAYYKMGNKKKALEKWLDMRGTDDYNEPSIRGIVDRHILKIKSELKP